MSVYVISFDLTEAGSFQISKIIQKFYQFISQISKMENLQQFLSLHSKITNFDFFFDIQKKFQKRNNTFMQRNTVENLSINMTFYDKKNWFTS